MFDGDAAIATLGSSIGFTVMVIVVVEAHCPAVGVNVYVVVAVLSNAGDHVPAIPSLDVVGKAFKVTPEHIAATGMKDGATIGLTTIVTSLDVAGEPAKQGVALDVITQVTTSLFANVVVMNVAEFDPMLFPLTFHW